MLSLLTSPPGCLYGRGSSSDVVSRKVGEIDRHGSGMVMDGKQIDGG
jgi:hypothetical protein